MSWQYIPAQISSIIGEDALAQTSGLQEQYRVGYYVGVRNTADEGYYLLKLGNWNVIQSPNNWIMTKFPFISFKCQPYDNLGNEHGDSFILSPRGTMGTNGDLSPMQPLASQSKQLVYAGKNVYYYESAYSMHFSPTEGSNCYIIHDMEYWGIPCEPNYSVSSLDGKYEGDYFWKCDLAAGLDLDYFNDYYPLTFTKAGNIDRLTQNGDGNYIDHITLDLNRDYYIYSSPSQYSRNETPPAGEYTHVLTGEKRYVGLQEFQATEDGSAWIGARLGRTGSSGEYWYSDQYGGYSHRIRYYTDVGGWGSVHSSARHEPYFLYQTPEQSLRYETSVPLSYYEWDDNAGEYVRNASKDLTLTKGPYQLSPTKNHILMGEFSQWR